MSLINYAVCLIGLNIFDSSNQIFVKANEVMMDSIIIHFEHTKRDITVLVLSDSAESRRIVESGNGIHNEELSKRFNSRIYQFPDDRVLEIKNKATRIDRFLYKNIDELIESRRASIIPFQGQNIVVTNYDSVATEKIRRANKLIALDNLVEELRRGYRLNNGKILIIYNDGRSSVYDSIHDLNVIDPFDGADIDENDVVERHSNLLITGNFPITVNILAADSKQVNKNRNSADNNLSKLLNKNVFMLNNKKIMLEYSHDIVLLFENETDFQKYTQSRANLSPANSFNFREDAKSFLEHRNLNIEKLAKILGLSSFTLDKSKNSLKKLDQKINTYFVDEYFIENIGPLLVNYLGEVLNKEANANWTISTYGDPDNNLHPKVKLPDGQLVDFIPFLWAELVKQRYTGDFSSESVIVGIMLGKSFKTN